MVECMITDSCLHHKAEMMIFEAARTITELSNVKSLESTPAVIALQLLSSSYKPGLRFAAVQTLNKSMSMLAESEKNQHIKLCRRIIRGAQKYTAALEEENEVEVRRNEHIDHMQRAMKVKGKEKVNVLVHSDREVNSLEKVVEEAPSDVRILLPKTRFYNGIQRRARGKGFCTWRV
ncbi:hypothetical protein NC652_011722 [Populus alba x Populus x berolinensis]|nr:hypothetical protein NC652_011722 [Populus alba x Populus x berolinensis]